MLSRGPVSFRIDAVPRPKFETRVCRLLHTFRQHAIYQTVRLYKDRILIDFDEAMKFTRLRLPWLI